MQMQLKIRGKNANKLSYLFGKRPDKVFFRNNTCVFYENYEDDFISLYVMSEHNTQNLMYSTNQKFGIEGYINDREFAISSIFLSDLKTVFNYVFNGNCKDYPDIVNQKFEIEALFIPVSAKARKETIYKCFNPLNYEVEITPFKDDTDFIKDMDNNIYTLKISGIETITNFFRQIYILMACIDNYRHHFVTDEHAIILKKYGEGWLKEHPLRNMITHRFLQKYKPENDLWEVESGIEVEENNNIATVETEIQQESVLETVPKKKKKLVEYRMEDITKEIKNLNPDSVVDMGCGEGNLIFELLSNEFSNKIIGIDPRIETLNILKEKITFAGKSEKVDLIIGSVYYDIEKIKNCNTLVLCEVIEHLDYPDLAVKNIFENIEPLNVIITSPNIDFNVFWDIPKGKFRFFDHRFEFTYTELINWCENIKEKYNYGYEIKGIGEKHELYGFPTFMAIFKKN